MTTEEPTALVEVLSARVHDAWVYTQVVAGRTSRLATDTGEEMMVPYDTLSEIVKDYDRTTVRAVLDALDEAGFDIWPRGA
jgi:hypothetical protein